MAKILQDFINNLKPNEGLAGLKSAFSFISERANIGKVVILKNDNTDVIFDNLHSKDTNPFSLTKGSTNIVLNPFNFPPNTSVKIWSPTTATLFLSIFNLFKAFLNPKGNFLVRFSYNIKFHKPPPKMYILILP